VTSNGGGGTIFDGGVSNARLSLFPAQISGCKFLIIVSISPLLLVDKFNGVAIIQKAVGVGDGITGVEIDCVAVCEGVTVIVGTGIVAGTHASKKKTLNRIVKNNFVFICTYILQGTAQR